MASRAEANERVLVRKSLHQLREYNEEQQNTYLDPVLTLQKFEKNWAKHTSGLDEDELADVEQARAKLRNYAKIYEIFEYCSELNEQLYVLEAQVSANNPSHPFSVYRGSASTAVDALIPDIEKCLGAYYGLLDDCEEYPEWRKKVELDLGGTVSYLALTIDDTARDAITEGSPVFARFDAEKQKYFK